MKIPALGQDFFHPSGEIEGAAQFRLARISDDAAPDFISARQPLVQFVAISAEGRKLACKIYQAVGDEVNDLALPLQSPVNAKHPRADDDAAKPLECFRPDDDVGAGAFVLKRYKNDALRAARPLADRHKARNAEPRAVRTLCKFARPNESQRRQSRANEGNVDLRTLSTTERA